MEAAWVHMNGTAGERYAGHESEAENVQSLHPALRTTLTRIEVALSNMDKAIRAIGERANRRQNQRWMNG